MKWLIGFVIDDEMSQKIYTGSPILFLSKSFGNADYETKRPIFGVHQSQIYGTAIPSCV